MEFQRPPRPRRPPAASVPSTFDPVGAVARIWAGYEGEAPGPVLPGRRRASSRDCQQAPAGVTGNADDAGALQGRLREALEELEAGRSRSMILEEELDAAQAEAAEAPEELRAALLEVRERLAAEVTEELLQEKDAWAEGVAAQALQQQEFESRAEAQCGARCLQEAEQLRSRLMQEFAEQEEDIRQLCRQRTHEELLQQARQQRDSSVAAETQFVEQHKLDAREQCESELNELTRKSQEETQKAAVQAEKQTEEVQNLLEVRLQSFEERLEADALEHVACQAVQAEVCQEAEELVENLEQQAKRDKLHFQAQLANREESCMDSSSRSEELEEQLRRCNAELAQESELAENLLLEQAAFQGRCNTQLADELAEHLASERAAFQAQYEDRTQAYMEDCLAAMERREVEAETAARKQLQIELAQEKDVQITRLQRQMEKKLAEGVAKQGGASTIIPDAQIAEALAQKESDIAVLHEQLLEAKRRRSAGGPDDLQQVEELQKLLELAHGENTELRESIRDLNGEINTQGGEIRLLEERVLDTLSGLRDGRSPQRAAVSVPPRATSLPGKSREATPPRAQPGGIRRLPPQPKPRQGSNSA